jgi:hypothetical protein
MSQYGGIGMEDIRKWKAMPMVTVIRLLGAMKRRLNPQSVRPGVDATPEDDAAIVALLEKKIRDNK